MNTMEFRRGGVDAVPAEADILLGERGVLEQQRMPIISHYFSILRRRKWIVLGFTLGMLLLGLVVTLFMTPKYTAAALIEIQRETRNFTRVEGVESTERNATDLEFYQTQYGLLEARSLADRVALELRLQDDPKFFEMFAPEQLEKWFDNGRVVAAKSTRDERVRKAGDLLLSRFEIEPERLSRLVKITFTSPDPGLSKRVIDAWSANFIKATLERRFETTAYARKFLEGRLAQLRGRIDESERSLVDYASREGIVNLPAASAAAGDAPSAGERSLVADDLATLNRELSKATAERVAAESRLGVNGGTVTEALENNAISSLRGRRAELAAEYARLMEQFEPNYPPAKMVQTQIQQLDRSISREEGRVSSTLRSTYEASLRRQTQLKVAVDQLKASLLDLRRRSIQYNIFERDVDTNRQLYDALLQRYKEIGVAGGVGVNNIAIVDAAEYPKLPSSPNLLLNLALALLIGMILGVSAALALEQIDEGVADPGELEGVLNVPLLGIMPKVTEGTPMEVLSDRKSPLSEAYLSFQTNLAFTTDHGVPRTVAVTSSRPGEGKSTTSFALAQSLARAGRRTLLVDGDMRSPSIHAMFGISNNHGLSNYLSGDGDLAKLVGGSKFENLSVMTAGPHPPSAGELLSSDRLERMISELLEIFDHVIFDAPPVMGLADAPLIASRTEGTVFVMESHATKKSMARVAVGRLAGANAQLLGAVLTKFDAKRAHYGYGYDYGYGYGYGDSAKQPA